MVLGARTRYATRFALFRVQIFRGSPLDHENHENITPRKIPAIRYIPPGCATSIPMINWTHVSAQYLNSVCGKYNQSMHLPKWLPVVRMTARMSSTHRTVIIRRSFAQQIVDHLKGQENEEKIFRHFVKKSNFRLLDLPHPLLESEMRQ